MSTTTLIPAATVTEVLPDGAARMSYTWIDQAGQPHRTDYPVPVDATDQRTPHIRYACPGHIEVDGQKQPCDHTRWLGADEPADRAGWCPHHGARLQPEAAAQGWVGWKDLHTAVGDKPRALVPLAGVAALGVAAQVGDVPPWVLIPAAVATPGAVWAAARLGLTVRAVRRGKLNPADQVRGRRQRRKIARRARHAAYAAAVGGVWLAGYSGVDPAGAAGVLAWPTLVAGWALLARPWWAYCDARRPTPVDLPPLETPTVEAPVMTAARAATEWAQHVGIANTAIEPGSYEAITCGWRAVVVATKRGALANLGGEALRATVKKIAAGYDVSTSAVTVIEEHDDSPNRWQILIQPSNPLREGQIWAGPGSIRVTKRAITAEVGRFVDGTPMVETLHRFSEGTPSELALGTTGSGKSERLRLSLVVQRWAHYVDQAGQRRGLFLSFLHDPKRLNSYGEFRTALCGYGMTRDDAHIMIDAFLREMVRRYDLLRQIRWVDAKGRDRIGSIKWDPRIHGPLIKVIWDEFHELAGDSEFVAKLEKLARYQRACGMGTTIASHMGTIGDTGSQALRDMLSGGRATLLRTTSGLNASLATGGQLVGDPRALPKAPGMALVADGESATVMGRYAYIPDDEAAGDQRALYDWLFDDHNNPIGYPAVIPPETAEAFGAEFMEWCEAGKTAEGRQCGTLTPIAPTSSRGSGSEGSSADALVAILATIAEPMSRTQIVAHPLWGGRNVTSTLSTALTKAMAAGWVKKIGSGPTVTHQITGAGRARVSRDESTSN